MRKFIWPFLFIITIYSVRPGIAYGKVYVGGVTHDDICLPYSSIHLSNSSIYQIYQFETVNMINANNHYYGLITGKNKIVAMSTPKYAYHKLIKIMEDAYIQFRHIFTVFPPYVYLWLLLLLDLIYGFIIIHRKSIVYHS